MPTITEQYRRDAETRVKELQASVDEYHELIEFLDLTGKAQTKAKPTKAKAKSETKSRSRKRTSTATAKRGRKPVRSLEFVKVIEATPGLTIREASKQIDGINETYLHRVGKELVKAGTLRKEGSRYFPVEDTDTKAVVIDTPPVVTNEVVDTTDTTEVVEDETTFDPFGSDEGSSEASDIIDLSEEDEVDEDQDF